MDDRAVGYALWLIPDDENLASIQEKIVELSSRCSTPEFPAHITLLSGLKDTEENLASATEELARSINPFSITVSRAGYRESYFRNLFIYVELTEDLKNLREQAFSIFEHEELKKKTFMPHVSLLYGHLATEEKERILMDIGHEFNMDCTIESLQLIKTEGRVENWEKVHTVQISEYN